MMIIMNETYGQAFPNDLHVEVGADLSTDSHPPTFCLISWFLSRRVRLFSTNWLVTWLLYNT
jgi:hypothetical protein